MIVAALRLCRTDIITIIQTKNALLLRTLFLRLLPWRQGCPAPGIESATTRSAVKLSIDYATALSVTIKTRENTIANA